jgi:galactose mutarotase-like enzyme
MGSGSRTANFDGERAHVLRAADGTEAWVVPAIGANCIALQVPLAGATGVADGLAHALSTPQSAAMLRGHPTGSGYPILSPHPTGGRLPLKWRGRTYAPPGGGDRLQGHGFAAGADWEVVDAGEAEVMCRLDTRRLDPGKAWWPWPFTLTARYRVETAALMLSLELESLHDDPAPVMLGLHPYFPLRFMTLGTAASASPTGASGVSGSDSKAGQPVLPSAAELVGGDEVSARKTCRVWVDADELWDLDRARAAWAGPALLDEWALRQPRSLTDLAETAARTGTASADGRMPVLFYGSREALAGAAAADDPAGPDGITSGVVDAASGLKLTLETSRAFGGIAVYTPPAHAAVSLEPRSTLLDALALAAAHPDLDTGVRTVVPGKPWRAWARLSVGEV